MCTQNVIFVLLKEAMTQKNACEKKTWSTDVGVTSAMLSKAFYRMRHTHRNTSRNLVVSWQFQGRKPIPNNSQ